MHAIVSTLVVSLLFSASAALAQGGAGSADRLESDLLHQRIDLSGVVVWERATKAWRPLGSPTADVLVINLWSKTCHPCLAEFPTFTKKISAKYGKRDDVRFLFIADPRQETSQQDVTEFWSHPLIALQAGETCDGFPIASGGQPRCLLELPDTNPGWSADERMANSLRKHPPLSLRPLTLLVDQQGIVRQIFSGSIATRSTEIMVAIDRLLAAVKSPATARNKKSFRENRTVSR